ncbi:MAG: serine acetyltransferase [Chitinispirillia bacterium]|nr:serine acetyltransferase [Chitinispirillia bacterium]MCL2268095.1 serine acetyltransferase [Chitinispirillia bacterium]
MDLNKWMNERLPQIVDRLEADLVAGPEAVTDDGLDFAGRNEIYDILDDILAVLFPGYYSREKVKKSDTNFFMADMLRHISFRLGKHIREVLSYRCRKDRCDDCSCEEKAHEALVSLIESLPEIRATLLDDIKAAKEGDPAAQFLDEIILSYPCVEAIATHRIAHCLYALGVPIIPRILSERAHSRTGIDIHPGAQIGPRFFIDHGTGVVIGETCRIGANVKIYQGVTLGATSPFDKEGKPRVGQKRHPDIEDDVIIYANATILGGNTVIGKGAVIGGNTWITKSVPTGEYVYNKE